MTNLNLALQGIGVMRTAAPTVELQLKSANSLNSRGAKSQKRTN